MQDRDVSLDVHLTFRALEVFFALSVFASLTVATCNTLVVAHGDILSWPHWAMNLAYWAGSITLASAGVGMGMMTYVALRPAGIRWALPPALLLGYFLSLGSAGHGSFFPVYDVYQVFVATAEGSEAHDTVAALRLRMGMHMFVLFLTPVAILAVGSIWASVTIAFRPTLLPRWMAALDQGDLSGRARAAPRGAPRHLEPLRPGSAAHHGDRRRAAWKGVRAQDADARGRLLQYAAPA